MEFVSAKRIVGKLLKILFKKKDEKIPEFEAQIPRRAGLNKFEDSKSEGPQNMERQNH